MSYRSTLLDLDNLIEQRFISVREHPAGDLFIYNYTAKAQFDGQWHPTTRKCRGLILDGAGSLVARPFEKFFNLGDEEAAGSLPEGHPEVWSKYDGSLGIAYQKDGRWAIASRGSFTSDQALRATRMLEEQYHDAAGQMQPDLTYLFEIIYPENRIVVDYGERKELRLLTVIDTGSGREYRPSLDYGFPIAQEHPQLEKADIYDLKAMAWPNDEGFVLFWRDAGYRLKVKFEQYVEMHRLVTGVSAKSVWEMLRAGQRSDLMNVARRTTPGFEAWVTGEVREIERCYQNIAWVAEDLFQRVPKQATRAEQAEAIKALADGRGIVQHCLFAMLDGKPYEDAVWKAVRPERGFAVYRKDGE